MDQSYRQEFKDLFDADFGALRQELAAVERRVEVRLEAMEPPGCCGR